MSSDSQLIATLHGGRTKKAYKAYWNPVTRKVTVESNDWFSSRIDTKALASSRGMAFHAAEAYLFDK